MSLISGLRRCAAAVAIAMVFPAAAQVPAAYAGPKRVDLSGTWDFRLDATRQGEYYRWFVGNDAAGWNTLKVPGSYNELLAKDAAEPKHSDVMRFYTGGGWYRTTFAAPDPGIRCFLHLSGTVLHHKVWVNGQMVGASERPYLEEAYDVTNFLRNDAPNTLVIEVDNLVMDQGIPDSNWHGWWNDGGLIRPVYLELRPRTHGQSDVTTTMDGHGGWKLDVATKVDRGGLQGEAEVAYSLLDKSGAVLWKQDAKHVEFAGLDGELRSSAAVAKVEAWSPEHPALYTLLTTVSDGKQVDETKVRIGFRQIEAKGTQILLNGQPVTIRGLSRHQFLAGKGMSLSVAEDRRDIEDLKALGANFVRLAHYTQSQDVYDACDELGLMVWTEIPAWQTSAGSLGSEAVWASAAEPQLRGMVEQNRNHPSVVVWSVANEIPSDKPEAAAYVAKAIAYVKSLDSSRLLTFASNRRDQDKALGSVDVIAVNEYFGWYYGKQTDVGPMLDQMHKLYPDKPLLVSEFGAEAIAGWTPPAPPAHSRDYSEAAQVSFLTTHMDQIYAPERRGFVAGAVIWVYNDFPDPGRVGGDQPASGLYRNSKGIVRMDRSRKPAYDTVKAFFGRLAESK